ALPSSSAPQPAGHPASPNSSPNVRFESPAYRAGPCAFAARRTVGWQPMTSMRGAPVHTRWRGSRRRDPDQAKFLTRASLQWVLADKAYTAWYLVRYYRLAKFNLANPHVILRGMVFLGKNVEIHSTPELSRLEIGRWVHIGDGNAIR